MGGTIGVWFLPVKAYFDIRKAGMVMRLGPDSGTSAAHFGTSAHLFVDSPATKAILNKI
jgi:hypothetical protein